MHKFIYYFKKRQARKEIRGIRHRRKPIVELSLKLGQRHWRTYLRQLYKKSPRKYRQKRHKPYRKMPFQSFHMPPRSYHRSTKLSPLLPHPDLLRYYYGQRVRLWIYEHRRMYVPIRYGFHPDVERRIRAYLLGHALDANDSETRRARLLLYLHSIGWNTTDVSYWLQADAKNGLRSTSDNTRFIYKFYNELINLPTAATVAYYGDPRVQGLFDPFRQNPAYRRYEYNMLRLFHPHTTQGVMRPASYMQSWFNRIIIKYKQSNTADEPTTKSRLSESDPPAN